ncbi:MAG: tRNA pseudouridine(55) synthase TruB [Betaproteobacteria bacterium TMED100]|nr:MAG: tRNA pseudouridine(55) synthase TruB [Betaproteobacteria bacterium TMED100]
MNYSKTIINGILLLDKPKGLSSNRALGWTKKIFNAKKAGHAGTLDPLATGILPILFGEATKFAEFGLDSDKRYFADIYLGTKTSTGDVEGEVIEKKSFNKDINVDKILDSFIGMQYQLPPMYSALKYQGKPLYKYARAGQEIKRNRRRIDIKSIKLVSLKNSFLRIDVTCSKGTYIRTLAEDIGEKLGSCAHLYNLRRVGVGIFDIDQSININKLELLASSKPDVLSHKLRPVDSFINHWPSMQLNVQQEKKFLNGQPIRVSPYNQRNENEYLVRVYGFSNDFLGTAQMINNEILRPKRLISK